MRVLVLIAALALAFARPAAAGPIDVGPPLGATAPSLHATDLDGRAVDLATISGPKGVVLIFFRSTKWCPYCQRQLIEFRAAQAPLQARGYRLAAISYDSPDVLRTFAKAQGVDYTLLSDPGSATIDAFGLRDPQYKTVAFAWGVPKPAIFVLSPRGVIRAKLAEEGYKVRPSVEAVLAAVDGVGR
jgi:peroxiredoxin